MFQVRRQLREHGIKIFDFKQSKNEEDDDPDDSPPFAVVSSNTLTTLEDGRVVRGREYPWGTVNIENKVKILLAKIYYTSKKA